MARKSAAAKTASSVDDLLDGISTTDAKKKASKVYKVDIKDAKVIKDLVIWRTNKLLESEATSNRKSVESDLAKLAVDELSEEIGRSGSVQPSVSFVFETEKDGEKVRNEINITANKNQWSNVADESVPELKKIFGDDGFGTYFEKDRTVSMTKEIDSDPQVIKDILDKVFGGDRDKFAKFFQVKTIYKVKDALYNEQYVDVNVTKKIKQAKEAGLLAQYSPAFSIKE